MKPFTIGAIQMKMSAKPEENLAKAIDMLEQAASKGVNVACLPELFMSHYFCQSEDHAKYQLAEEIPGNTTHELGKIAKKHNMVIIASLFEKRMVGMYHNTAAIIDADGQMVDIYRKMHIPDDPLYYEKFYFTPGDLGFKATPTKYAKIGTLICWDQWFPEGARATALKGADALFYPTAIGWHPSEKAEFGEQQVSSWQTIQRSHAIANGIYVCAVNRIGHEGGHEASTGALNKPAGDGIEFFGHSFICDPYGTVIAQASRDKEEIITAVYEPEKMEAARQHWPFFRDRRIEHYAPLLKHPEV